ncbi:hypothetical protein HK096_000471, partial [Nowakowskiella sp. JEL0078]
RPMHQNNEIMYGGNYDQVQTSQKTLTLAGTIFKRAWFLKISTAFNTFVKYLLFVCADEQVQRKREQKIQEKEKSQIDDEKLRVEIASYDPWGKAGAGAPMRNSEGGIISNRNTRYPISNEYLQPQPQQIQQQNYFTNTMIPETGLENIGFSGLFDQLRVAAQNQNQTDFIPFNFQQISGISNLNTSGSALENFGMPPQVQSSFVESQKQQPIISTNQKSFLRGVVNVDTMSPWQKEEFSRKQLAKQATQDILKMQIAEKENQRKLAEQQRQIEEQKEQDRIIKEQEMLRQRYSREHEEQRRKE